MKIPFELFFCLFDSKRLHGHNTPQRYSKNIYYYACYVIDKKPAKKKRHNALIFFSGINPHAAWGRKLSYREQAHPICLFSADTGCKRINKLIRISNFQITC